MPRPLVRQWGRQISPARERKGCVCRCRDGDGIGGSEDVAKITSPSARRRSPAWRRAVAFCNGSSKGTLAGARPVQLCGYLKTRGATKMCRASLRRGAKRGNLDRQTTLVNVIIHQHEITVVKGKMKLRWETKIPNRARRKVLNLPSDISLARKKIILMLGSECRKRIANFRTKG